MPDFEGEVKEPLLLDMEVCEKGNDALAVGWLLRDRFYSLWNISSGSASFGMDAVTFDAFRL